MGAPAAAKVAAALVLGRNPPVFLNEYRLDLDRILPARLTAAAMA